MSSTQRNLLNPHSGLDIPQVMLKAFEVMKHPVSLIKFIGESDVPYRVVYINPAFREMLGLEPGSEWDRVSTLSLIPDEDRAKFLTDFVDMYARGGEVHYRMIIKGQQRWMRTELTILDPGELFLAITTDITAECEYEMERSRLLEQYKEILRVVPNPLMLIEGTTIKYGNNAALYVFSRHISHLQDLFGTESPEQNLAGLDLMKISEGLPVFGETIREITELRLAGKLPSPYEFALPGLNGETYRYWYYTFSVPGIDDNTRLISIVDVTDVYKVMEMAQELELQKRLLAIVNKMVHIHRHEFANPITSMRSNLFLLKRGMELDRKDMIERCLKSLEDQLEALSDSLDTVVKDVDQMSQEMQIGKTKTELGLIAEQVVQQFQNKVEVDRPDTFQINLSNQIGNKMFLVDPIRMRQLLTNLIGNAIKYSPNGGSIQIDICENNGELLISVSDQGIGISEDDQRYIFEFDFRAGNVGQIDGSGIGLYVVNQIVEGHGGQINVESALGHGSKFSIRIPLEETKETI